MITILGEDLNFDKAQAMKMATAFGGRVSRWGTICGAASEGMKFIAALHLHIGTIQDCPCLNGHARRSRGALERHLCGGNGHPAEGRFTGNGPVAAYSPSPDIFGEEYIAEMLETKAEWNFASPDEGWVRRYLQELEDFLDCLLAEREPLSGLDLALSTVEAIYDAFLSAEKGGRVGWGGKNLSEMAKANQ